MLPCLVCCTSQMKQELNLLHITQLGVPGFSIADASTGPPEMTTSLNLQRMPGPG